MKYKILWRWVIQYSTPTGRGDGWVEIAATAQEAREQFTRKLPYASIEQIRGQGQAN